MEPTTSIPEASPALAAYEQIAPHYDAFTAHHDYELWLGQFLPALERHGLGGQQLLDVGCGTGKSFLPMLERGWDVVGVDLSPAMLARARAKAPQGVRLERHDMRRLPLLGSFDLVWALDDAINYLLAVDDLTEALVGLRRNLAPSGLLAFDVNTLASYRGFFAEGHVVQSGDHELGWIGHGSRSTSPGSEVTATFAVSSEAGVDTGVHRQRHFKPEELQTAFAQAGLRCLAVYGHGYDAIFEQPLDEARHTKAIYIANTAEGR